MKTEWGKLTSLPSNRTECFHWKNRTIYRERYPCLVQNKPDILGLCLLCCCYSYIEIKLYQLTKLNEQADISGQWNITNHYYVA